MTEETTQIDNTIDRTAVARQKALFSGDAKRYYLICRKAGINPEFFDLYEQGRLEVSQEAKRNQLGLERTIQTYDQARHQLSPKRTKINYFLFWQEADNDRINPEDIFSQIDWKREILRKAGYTHLTGERGERVTIDSAKKTRIGHVFRNTYIQAKKRFEKD